MRKKEASETNGRVQGGKEAGEEEATGREGIKVGKREGGRTLLDLNIR